MFILFFMLKFLNVIIVLLFVLAASAAPHISAKSAASAFNQTPAEKLAQGNNLEEEIHHPPEYQYYFFTTEITLNYPLVKVLKPKQLLYDVLKPPSRIIS